MTYYTQSRDYPVPTDGQEPWDEDYQNAMQLLDSDIGELYTNRVLPSDLYSDTEVTQLLSSGVPEIRIDKLFIDNDKQNPNITILSDSPPSDSSTQTFDIINALNSGSPSYGVYKIEFGTNHTQENFSGGRGWIGEIWVSFGEQGATGTLNISISTVLAPKSLNSNQMSISVNDKGVVKYSTGFVYCPELVINARKID